MSVNTKEILSLTRVRLASTSGHIIVVEPGVPTRIPEALFAIAAQNGCVDYNPEMLDAFQAAVKNAQDEAVPQKDKKPVDMQYLLKDAVRQVVLAGREDSSLNTGAGLPRVPAVRAAFEALCTANDVSPDVSINSAVVEEYFLQVQEEAEAVAVVETPENRYADVSLGDLEGEEVGGDVGEMLGRVGDADE